MGGNIPDTQFWKDNDFKIVEINELTEAITNACNSKFQHAVAPSIGGMYK